MDPDKRILVAEDTSMLRKLVVRTLERKGLVSEEFPALEVQNPEEALQIINDQADQIALVITDLRMPDLGDGEKVAKEAIQRGIPVIVMSGTIDDLSEEIATQCAALPEKPFRIEELLAAVHEVLNQNK